MLSYIFRRLAIGLVFLFGIAAVIVGLQAGNDPALEILGPSATSETIAALRRQLGLDQSFLSQVMMLLGGTLSGDLGVSLSTRQPVSDLVASRLSVTALLVAYGGILSVSLGLFFGMLLDRLSAPKRARLDAIIGAAGNSTPVFFSALVLLLAFAIYLPMFPAFVSSVEAAKTPFSAESISAFALPAATLAIATLGQMIRIAGEELDDLPFPSSERSLFTRSAAPAIGMIGQYLALAVPLVVVIETIFAAPGLGRLFLEAVLRNDFPLIQTLVLFCAFFLVAVNILTDLIQCLVDPAIRMQRAGRVI